MQRKNIRLKDYDYSQAGCYFVTICVKDKHELLGNVVGRDAPGAPYMQLSEYGEVIRKEIENTNSFYNEVSIDKFAVMPNHVHILLSIQNENGAPRASRPTTALIPRIVAMLKKKTNKIYGFNMWQTSYHDHVVRGQSDYRTKWRYIDQNPARWAEDEYYK